MSIWGHDDWKVRRLKIFFSPISRWKKKSISPYVNMCFFLFWLKTKQYLLIHKIIYKLVRNVNNETDILKHFYYFSFFHDLHSLRENKKHKQKPTSFLFFLIYLYFGRRSNRTRRPDTRALTEEKETKFYVPTHIHNGLFVLKTKEWNFIISSNKNFYHAFFNGFLWELTIIYYGIK